MLRSASHGISYRSISDLLTQNGIPTSDVSVMKFCHRFLNEKRPRKSSANRRPANRANRASLAKSRAGCSGQSHDAARAGHEPKTRTRAGGNFRLRVARASHRQS